MQSLLRTAARRLIIKALGCLALAVALLLAAGILYRFWILRRSEKQLIVHEAGGIDEALFVGVGGTQQWVTIRGHNRSPGADDDSRGVREYPMERSP
jgi:hypothetical protein